MKILNFGSCNIDYVYSLDHFVKAGETETTDKLEIFPGGKGLNQSIALARAGASVYHAGCIGHNGDFLMDILKNNGVDTSFMQHVDVNNGHAIIQLTKEGENSIFLYPGSNAQITEEYVDSVLSNFEKGDVILLQNELNNLEYIIDKAYEIGMQIYLNPSPYNEIISNIDINKVSCLIFNEIEAKDISGLSVLEDVLQYFKNNYPNLKIMLTLGKDGCIYQDSNYKIHHPIFKVDVVDTTAAGDTFTGYFIALSVTNKSYQEAIKTASCASALTCSRKGASPSIPYLSEVLSRINTLNVDDVNLKRKNITAELNSYLDKNLSTASLEEFAKSCGYSTVYMGKLIKDFTGSSFKDLLKEKRLAECEKLLVETDLPIAEILEKLGYENKSFFRKIFKEKFGKNFLEYRKEKIK
ncbi:MAG: helix-turn-helix domain-containing protein [Clostridiales bacterium]|nr:helix-turn-helix domain-containing protein [Clostridiales bacterium]